MIDNEYLDSKAWPFVEARELLKKRQKLLEKKGYALFQTGYGPSGLPHIGTFGEVCRTTMVIQAFKKISDIPTKLFTFSDDMDGLRKVPENISNKEVLEKLRADTAEAKQAREKIIASIVSGDDNGFSLNTAEDSNFSFYNNTIDLNTQVISPIAEYAFNYYDYKLEGVFYDDLGNLINKIQVLPKRDNDAVFSGLIYIVEDSFEIYPRLAFKDVGGDYKNKYWNDSHVEKVFEHFGYEYEV